ncbi:DUF6461 domain-containing protein [Actinoalloteichus hymeniacidonis]|uniref:Uncharacterized protein n=1 Tax=Actinoalloteichus hymeniacidonis TaxID=340345 RepID=A0AAC9MYM4_9PSEU|nr:DUF6461 domain-containing protein [Actinoalloteichus hymeniacidonis]AOS63450.1 hypothetical protein TL08_13180 [Actinoalloteichus hymeniacidonis]MBB5908508.1 hypothetical protein [Actinoalloteichus hymeniacidonis]
MSDEIRTESEREWPARTDGKPGFCFSFVHHTLPEQALCLLGGEQEDIVVVTPERAVELTGSFDLGYPEVAQAVRIGDWTVLVEVDGFQGTRREVLRSLSENGEVYSIFHDGGATGQFSHAVDGELRTCFDQLAPERRWGAEPDALLAAMAEVGLGESDGTAGVPRPAATALALVERLTGVVVTEAHTTGHLLTVPFHAPLPDARPALRPAVLEPHAPEAAARLKELSRPSSRAELIDLVRGMAEAAGLLDSEALRAALVQTASGAAVALDRGSPLYDQVMAWQVDHQRARRSAEQPGQADRLDTQARAAMQARYEVGLAVRDAFAVLNKVR